MMHKLVVKSRALKKKQDRRMDTLRAGGNPDDDEVIEVGEPDVFDVEVVEGDALEQAA